MYRVLSLDGGGVRGIIPAVVLANLEARTGRAVSDLFDLVAATSTGALVALGLVRPGAGGRPARTAQEMADSYELTSKHVFRRSAWSRVWTANGFLAPKYAAVELERRLRAELGEVMLSDALGDVLITSYDLRHRQPYFFKAREIRAGNQADQPMWRVARATSAAPTYFPPFSLQDGETKLALVDGGVVANNPSMCAYAEVSKLRQDGLISAEDVVVVSIGCGAMDFDYATARTMLGGKINWAKPMFDIVLDAQEDGVDYQMRHVMANERYFRLQADLPELIAGERTNVDDIDNASRANLNLLRKSALDLVKSSEQQLARIAALLDPDSGEVPA